LYRKRLYRRRKGVTDVSWHAGRMVGIFSGLCNRGENCKEEISGKIDEGVREGIQKLVKDGEDEV